MPLYFRSSRRTDEVEKEAEDDRHVPKPEPEMGMASGMGQETDRTTRPPGR